MKHTAHLLILDASSLIDLPDHLGPSARHLLHDREVFEDRVDAIQHEAVFNHREHIHVKEACVAITDSRTRQKLDGGTGVHGERKRGQSVSCSCRSCDVTLAIERTVRWHWLVECSLLTTYPFSE